MIKAIFENLKKEYECIMENDALRLVFNPIKEIHDVEFVDGVSVRRESVLKAITMSGVKSEKRILVDDRDGTYREVIDCGGHTLTDTGVTTFRCGLMTALCIDRLSSVLYGKVHGLRVGFIGNGRTNLQNCETIRTLFGIKEVVIRGSENNRAKNVNLFKEKSGNCNVYIDYTENLALLNQCDVVVVCTSSYKPEYLISADKLKDVPLIIALDCGYVLDESFREQRISLTDHIEQISHYYESEFPFDNEKECYFRQMKKDSIGEFENEKVTVYLHGIALADAVTAEGFLEYGMVAEKCRD